MDYTIVFLALLAGCLLGVLAGWFWFSKGKHVSVSLQNEIAKKEQELDRLTLRVQQSQSQIKTAEAEARVTAKEILSEAKAQATEMEAKIEKEQGRLEEKEKSLDEKVHEVERQRANVQKQESEVATLKTELTAASAKHREALESVSKLTQEQAKEQLKEELVREFSDFYAGQAKLVKEQFKEEAEEEAKNLLAEAMQRYASEVATESTATVVQLPSDDVKGKIIGKEGRNITAFEAATGVDIIIDDTPGAIVISGYDLARRYVAKLAMEKLIKDGRIQPARIEEVVTKMKEEVGKMMLEFGKRAAEELSITNYPQDLLKIIGRLRFRTSYGQNVLKHSLEMANIGRMLAEEIGADAKIVAEGCLLHDVGKALDHEVSGTHVEIGLEIARKFKVRPEVLHCIASHHNDVPIESPEAFIVAAADAISGARPGARRESFEAYVRRLKELEETAKSFEGVKRAFAISAGREVRVYVDTEKVDDLQQAKLAKDIAEKIEKDLTYPGVIKVNVIRERRVEETAK
ncbi:MAG TPA: ribonuclease Y [Candidatus Peribacter riflensis]|uniref:Ribonuclease Y n=1 Tax=Candidatus Peribacter riflensis TaxID=1735162 RepID=A0A0S1SR81_9BACT|nr:MAG: metal dependent phosphohydrolase [Candidatus Peribacter riflensis]OGJ77289.1 MAG: ribonuclease Y [Candidatus Peribacteria bacterium RIFOXYB1_FULL_57_12]OGJ83061.1 MAG: ribonuclease Y [Candidatus Peribacteria bacterium RIFOXYC1_FULL_58_8]ALM10731.1 MAG: metal dependent phosphohydrolase [Candidatus Peribacter riflensis]ALM11833.1 MAG: metal dependent phosphohydrolase [Candidatus Peribacter riflensis]